MLKSPQISRRSFLKTCSVTAAATGLPLWFLERELAEAAEHAARIPPAPNDRPNIALIGSGGMGRSNAREAQRYGNVVAVCDVDQSQARGALQQLSRGLDEQAVIAEFKDFRRVLERNDIHIIINATPDHWHTLINIAAAKAKKDIFGQKPLTLTVEEGQHVIKTVRDNKVVFQVGSQQRSDQRFRLACELLRNGRIGKLQTVDVWVPAGLTGGPFQARPVPEGFDFDFWMGPTPKVEYLQERTHSTFRWWYEYAGGPMTDWGAHHNDIARWAIGQDGPLDVEGKVIVGPSGAGPNYYNTPAQFEATFTWGGGIKHHVKTTVADSPFGQILDPKGQRNGVKFTGSDGWIWVNRGSLSASKDEIYQTPLPDNAIRLEVSTNHMANFMDAVKSRKDPIVTVETGHLSAVVGHLSVIAVRLGRKLQWDPAKETFIGEGAAEANTYLVREMRKPYDFSFA
jgi:predicted dehydrogenase